MRYHSERKDYQQDIHAVVLCVHVVLSFITRMCSDAILLVQKLVEQSLLCCHHLLLLYILLGGIP